MDGRGRGAVCVHLLPPAARAEAPPAGPVKVLPNLKAAAVTSVQVRPAAQLGNPGRPHQRRRGSSPNRSFIPPRPSASKSFWRELERLTPAPYITARELRGRPNADEEYGFATPLASILIEQPGYTARLRVGARTAPGDQVFLQVVGVEGVYVVDAEFPEIYSPRRRTIGATPR